jgi:hypothetical protein
MDLYALVIDYDHGRSKDFNLSYLRSCNFEVYQSLYDRDARVQALRGMADVVSEFTDNAGPRFNFAVIPFEIQADGYNPIPTFFAKELESESFAITENAEKPGTILITDPFNG